MPKLSKRVSERNFKEYLLLSLEEMRAREMKYTSRLVDLRACLNHVDDAVISVSDIVEKMRALNKWLAYLKCDGIPKPYIPADIRMLFVKMRFFEDINVEQTIDWLLSVDERSVLTQDYEKKDMTRRTLVKEIRPNFGKLYDDFVDTALQVYHKMEYYLTDDLMIAKASPRILLDILEAKVQVQTEIQKFFDRYCYRILAGEDSFMESVGLIAADFCYEGHHFKMHIWTLKDVPILFDFILEPSIEADLHLLNVTINIPHDMLEDNLTIRGIHMDFDHFSPNAKSYEQDIIVPDENLNAGIPDLHECLINEWNMQIDMQNNVRNEMIQRRIDWEEKMIFLDEELKAVEKLRKEKPGKKIKNPKVPKEVPLITGDTYPDIYEDFLDKEQSDFENFINNVYHPRALKLTEHEINLKRFFILGGVYQFDAVVKPRHFKFHFNRFTMTWHENEANLQIRKDYRARLERDRQSTVDRLANWRFRSSRASAAVGREEATNRPSVRTTLTIDPEEIDMDGKYFCITFDLPRHLCLWGGEPIACQFEDDVIGYVEPKVTPVQMAPPPPPPAKPTTPSPLPEGTSQSPSVTTFIHKMDSGERMSVSSNIYRTSLSLASLAAVGVRRSNIFGMDDFHLCYTLNKTQIRNLQRYCIPRMLSSFKFPREILETRKEELANKPKGIGGTLLRKRDSDEDIDMESGHMFTYHQQNNPERMFPVFPAAENPNIYSHKMHLEEQVVDNVPETFRDLVDILQAIKVRFKRKYEATRNMPPVRSKTNMELLRIKLGYNVPNLKADFKRSVVQEVEEQPFEGEKRQSSYSRVSHGSIHNRGSFTSTRRKSRLTIYKESSSSLENRETYTYSHWTTEHIKKTEFDKANSRITIWTDRLGTFGFAFKRYEHFPFKFWSVAASEQNPDTEIIFTLETQFVKCVLHVTGDGYHGYCCDPTKAFVRNRAMYLVIDKPINDFKELKRMFKEKHLNIFTDHDARFYIENGYFSEKHLAAELHTYSCMAINSLLMRYQFSSWNRLAKRRDIVLRFGPNKEPDENLQLVRITPEETTFVEIQELCSDDFNIIKLQYTLTWRNIEFYADLNQAIISVTPTASEMRLKDPRLICSLKNLLSEIRPLSYS